MMITNPLILALAISRPLYASAWPFCKLPASCLEMHLRRNMSVRDPLWPTIRHEPFNLRHLMSCFCKFDLWKRRGPLKKEDLWAEPRLTARSRKHYRSIYYGS
jgi:hypothetical protein